METNKTIKIVYKNWRGKISEREIEPLEIWFGSTKWHPGEQWFLRAKDIRKNTVRDFTLKDITEWLE